MVAADNLEEVGALELKHPDLQRWRDAIGEAVILNPDIAEDGVDELLQVRLLPETLQRDVRYDLRFGFTRRKTPVEEALLQLRTMLRFLAQERSIRDELEEYDRQAVASLKGEGDEYTAIESSRQRLREARATLFSESADWNVELP
jgi:hypothetical protein